MSLTLPPVRTRLTDLAEQAGVSTATVSRVLNGKHGVLGPGPASRAGRPRRARLRAAEKLRTRSAGLVGLVVPELSNPVFPAFAQVIETMLTERGYTPLLCTQSPGGTTEDQYVEMLLEHAVDGIVFVSGLHADTTPARSGTTGCAAAGCRSCWSTASPRASTPRRSPPTTRPRSTSPFRHLVSLGPPLDRAGDRPGAVRPGRAQTGGVRRQPGAPPRRDGRGPARRHDAVHGRGRAGGGARAHRLRAHRDHLRLGPHGARRHPRGPVARAVGAAATCRWSASTTPRSSPSPTRR